MALARGMAWHGVDGAGGRVELSFDPGPHVVQGTGVLQGGALAGIGDHRRGGG